MDEKQIEGKITEHENRLRVVETCGAVTQRDVEDIKKQTSNHLPHQIEDLRKEIQELKEYVLKMPNWKYISLLTFIIGVLVTIVGVLAKALL